MARIGENAFRQYRDGQDRLTAREYMAEREQIRLAINDTEDKVERVESIREEFINTVNEVETVKGDVVQTKQEIETRIGDFSQTIDQTAQELQQAKEEVQGISEHVSDIAIDVKSFGVVGDGVVDDSDAIEAALNFVKSVNGKLISEKSKTYLVKRPIHIDTSGMKNLHWDMKGSTIDFTTGGSIVLGSSNPFKTTTLTGDLKRNRTSFTVADITGVKKGDLVSIQSPVEWVKGVPLIQYYTIGDMDTALNTIYVDGLIVGDITEQQKTLAGVTGDIVVSFYKLSKGLTIENGTLKSTNRDDEGTLIFIKGQDRYNIRNIEIRHPKRNGIYVSHSGTGIFDSCRTKGHGYVTKDQGYVNEPSSPEGLSFGYGFISSNCYLTHFINCHSYSGWHGFDIARGQTFTIFQDCVIHKDAYGFSAHEGAWDMRVIGCQVIGGMGVTSRAAELTVQGCTIKTSLSHALSGNGSHHKLVVKDNIFELNGVGGNAILAYFNTPYPEYCYSSDDPVSDFSGNVVMGLSGSSRIFVRGKLKFTNNNITAVSSGNDSSISIQSNNSVLGNFEINNNSITNAGLQAVFTITGNTSEVSLKGNSFSGNVGIVSNSAFVYLQGTHPKVFITDNNVQTLGFVARVLSGQSVFDLFQNNKAFGGRLLLADTTSIVKNAVFNTAKNATIVAGGVAVTNNLNNVTLST